MRTAADARRARDAVRYPPLGARGTCSVTRAAGYRRHRPTFAEHVDAILEEGVEVAFSGRADLSTALGVPSQLEHSRVIAAVDRVLAATQYRSDR
ncbi:MAG: hypothetical protein HY329_25055 [Chloroflexi bacterium]|nr:hypothetical protein [Chloroflexota bacterium]